MLSRLYTLIVVGLMAGGGVLAAPVASKALEARQSFTGSATFFSQNGLAGACGQVHNDSDFIVSLQPGTFANGAHCGATVTITDTNTGTTATGIVADECPTCSGPGDLDLSVGLFEVFASTNAGIIPVSWHF